MSADKETLEIPEKIAESASNYIDRLATSHEKFAERLENTRARNTRINDKIMTAMIDGQRDALALSKTIIADPMAYAKNIEAMMASFSTAQERTLDVAKTVYQENASAGGELRDMFDTVSDSSKMFTKPFEKMNEMWTQAAK